MTPPARHPDKDIRAFIEQIESHLDRIADSLAECSGYIDADVAANLAKNEVTYCISLQARTLDEAVSRVKTIARTALHASGGSTPGWESVGIAIPSADGDRSLELT